MKIEVIDGDITRQPCDTLVVGVNSFGDWRGALDLIIRSIAGNDYHLQLANALLADPELRVQIAHQLWPHLASFRDVVFVIDDLQEPLEKIVLRGLISASVANYRRVAMPLIRFGKMRDRAGSPEEKLESIARAISDWRDDSENNIDTLLIVVYNEPETSAKLRALLAL